jgi:hypothetical protein
MNREKLYQELRNLNGKFVTVIVKGAIEIPFYITNFEFQEYPDYVAFGEFESEDYPFQIDKDNIHEIFYDPMLNDEFSETYHVRLKLLFGDFITYVSLYWEN